MKLLIPTDYSENSIKAFSFIYSLYQSSITDYVFLNVQNARHAGSLLSLDSVSYTHLTLPTTPYV